MPDSRDTKINILSFADFTDSHSLECGCVLVCVRVSDCDSWGVCNYQN